MLLIPRPPPAEDLQCIRDQAGIGRRGAEDGRVKHGRRADQEQPQAPRPERLDVHPRERRDHIRIGEV
ncbi:MAG: hypothetical protein ACK55I_20730, partial [bacterium]